MSTIILNGSPKGNAKDCNSQIYAEHFISKMKNPCEIRCIAKADPEELTQYVKGFDTIIVVLPLYIHAMPGIVMKFIEKLEPAATPGKSMGFIIQAGFAETAQERFVERYYADLAKQLNYSYLGTVSKGEAAATYMFPRMFKKALNLVADLGAAYEETHAFDPEIIKKLSTPYQLSKSQLAILRFMRKVGLDNVFWHKAMKQHNALDKRLDKPFL